MNKEYIELTDEEIAAIEQRMQEEFEWDMQFENGKEN